jgi:hypothetical protein
MTLPNFRPLSFGEILDGAFTLYRRNFLRFLGTSALLMTGMMVGMMLVGIVSALVIPVLPLPLLALVLTPVAMGLVAMVWSSLTWQAARSYEGKPASLGDSVEAGLIGAIPLVGTGLIAGMVFTAAAFAVMTAAMALQYAVQGTGSLVLGTLAMPVGVAGVTGVTLFAAILLFAVLPAVVLEEKGPWEAITRSVQLGRGARLRILGLLVVAVLIVTLPSIAVMGLTGGFAQIVNPQAAAAIGLRTAITQQLLSLVVSILTAPFLPSVLVLLYFDRRVRTEALDVQIAAGRLTPAGA